MRRVAVFTLHKCASMFIYKILTEVCQRNQFAFVSVNDPEYKTQIRTTGYYRQFWDAGDVFGPIRLFEPPPADSDIVLHLRDPRDILVSLYFSFVYSHSATPVASPRLTLAPFAHNEESRTYWREAGIDKFVIEVAPFYRQRFLDYLGMLENRPDAHLLTYEEMVLDFDSWLKRFLSAFPVDQEVERIALSPLGRETVPRSENQQSHVRQASPGDHRRKLRVETIHQLDGAFGDILGRLGYPAHGGR